MEDPKHEYIIKENLLEGKEEQPKSISNRDKVHIEKSKYNQLRSQLNIKIDEEN